MAARTDLFKLKSYTYRLRKEYGGPEEDTNQLVVRSAVVGAAGKTVEIVVDNLRAGYVHEFDLQGLRSAEGKPLLHADAYHSLIKRP